MSSTTATFRFCSCTEAGRRCAALSRQPKSRSRNFGFYGVVDRAGQSRASGAASVPIRRRFFRPRCGCEVSGIVQASSGPKYCRRVLGNHLMQQKNLARIRQRSVYSTKYCSATIVQFVASGDKKSRPGGHLTVFCIPHTMEAHAAPVVRKRKPKGKVRKFTKRWVFNLLGNTLKSQSKKIREVHEYERVQKASD